MAKKDIRPKMFRSRQAEIRAMKNVGNALVQETLDSGMKSIVNSKPENMKVTRMPKYLKLTEERMKKLEVLDLKPFFAKSSKKRMKKDGGWYLVVPIKLGARKMKKNNRRMYEQLRAIDIAPAERKTVISDYLYDRRRVSDASMLNYEPRSHNIDKIRTGKNRHDYVAFRTVSDKSPMNSWIINRDKVNEKDTSKTFIRNVNRLMKWKMRNGFR